MLKNDSAKPQTSVVDKEHPRRRIVIASTLKFEVVPLTVRIPIENERSSANPIRSHGY
jgi:hypothetical protein